MFKDSYKLTEDDNPLQLFAVGMVAFVVVGCFVLGLLIQCIFNILLETTFLCYEKLLSTYQRLTRTA